MIKYLLLGLIILLLMIWGVRRFINTQKTKIRSAAGVQKTQYITIGGIEQYIQIRGQDITNPIIIIIHGGPGNNMAYYSYYWQVDLEKAYTIVHWDQRGCGNTYYHNTEAVRPTLDLLLSDLDELVNHIRAEYGKEKVVIMGHSWGTLLGGVYAGGHPEKVSAYVGIGHFSDMWKMEQTAAEEAVRLATAAGKTDDAKKIEEQFQLVRREKNINMRELVKLRQLAGKYLPEGDNTPFSARLLSPHMTWGDFKWFFAPMFGFDKFIEIQSKIYELLYSENGLSEYNYSQYEVPVIIFAGDCDWITPCSNARDYFDSISAPQKEFILIEKAGHIPFMPGRFTEALRNALNDTL